MAARVGLGTAQSWDAPADTAASETFPEIDCIRAMLGSGVADAAEQRAARLGLGADRVLITAGTITEDDYLSGLARQVGSAFEPLDGTPRSACPISSTRLLEAAALGLLPLTVDDEPCLVVAPRGVAARRLVMMIKANPSLAPRFRFTSAERLTRYTVRCCGSSLTTRARDHLKQRWPFLSAAPPRWRTKRLWLAVLALAVVAASAAAPSATLFVFEIMLAAVFLAWFALRLTGVLIPTSPPAQPVDTPDGALPVYTIMAALYKEAASVDGLLRAIERLDYPPEKLDVIIAVEADDHETRRAILGRDYRIPITVIPVAASEPRTKPKALNFALPFARGSFTVVYDAEDRPQPGQLRNALAAFENSNDDLACVQARLCIDNTADSSLTRLFTAEYAGQFDVFLPGLASLRLPLPLGGSSNHFRGIR